MPPRAESGRQVLDVVIPVGVALFQVMVLVGPPRADRDWLTLLGVIAGMVLVTRLLSAGEDAGLSVWAAGLVVAGWVAAFLGPAVVVLDRRDV